MRSLRSLIETQEQLRVLADMLDRQEKLLDSLKEGKRNLAVARRFLRGLEAIIDRLEHEVAFDAMPDKSVTKH